MSGSLAPLRVDGVVPYPPEAARAHRERGHWIGQTHAEMLAASARAHADRTAIIAGDERITYRALRDRVLRLAAGLADLGIARGDRVVVHLPNIPEHTAFTFALFELGAIPVFALAAHRRTEIEHMVRTAEARAYIAVASHDGADLAGLADELLRSAPSLAHAILVAPGGGGEAVVRLLAHAPLADEPRSLPEDLAFLQLSGGTTGTPKLIPRTHDDYLCSVRESNRICGVTADTVQLAALPLSHNFTMSSPGVLGALAAGATIVLASDGSPDTAFPLIERHRVTQAALVPPLVLAWLNSPRRAEFDLSSLEVLQVGGAKFSEEAARRVGPELGCTLQQVFGMAEGLVNYTRLDDDIETIVTTQGRPISPDDEVRVVDDDDRDVPDGESGHLLTRGPYTIRGYFRAPEHNRRSFTADGFYRTGDIVRRLADGSLTVVGRAKDQINRGGEKIAPEEVENLLLGHDGVHDASVVGVPDAVLGQRTKAYVIARNGADAAALSARALRRHLRERGVAVFKIPDAFELVDAFPSTGVGKVSKRDQRADVST
ncbi:(2,3-dihydroxybenzoyl)adenylate synthase [Microbacterium karelineae]|uniref:(2,3-dihydroxybenzoyl)adenylate synthase n=1 Tax=Microbacterium karelineae TaxID=2654283 RepID=UPI0012EA2986|nr:AMP-binding protein [Microbacterium karelineae]